MALAPGAIETYDAAAAGVATWAVSSAHATTYTWKDGAGAPSWSTAANWNPSTNIPLGGDTANVTGTNGTAFICSYDYLGSVTLSQLTVDLTGTGSSFGDMIFATTLAPVLTATNEYIGDSGRGLVIQDTGSNTLNSLSSNLVLGLNSGSNGEYVLGGNATLTSDGSESIGYLGAGTFNQAGGTNNEGDWGQGSPYLGEGGAATYNLSGGTLNFAGNTEYIGFANAATFNQTGGTNSLSVVSGGNASLALGTDSGSVGTYDLSGTGYLVASGFSSVGSGQGAAGVPSAVVPSTPSPRHRPPALRSLGEGRRRRDGATGTTGTGLLLATTARSIMPAEGSKRIGCTLPGAHRCAPPTVARRGSRSFGWAALRMFKADQEAKLVSILRTEARKIGVQPATIDGQLDGQIGS